MNDVYFCIERTWKCIFLVLESLHFSIRFGSDVIVVREPICNFTAQRMFLSGPVEFRTRSYTVQFWCSTVQFQRSAIIQRRKFEMNSLLLQWNGLLIHSYGFLRLHNVTEYVFEQNMIQLHFANNMLHVGDQSFFVFCDFNQKIICSRHSINTYRACTDSS